MIAPVPGPAAPVVAPSSAGYDPGRSDIPVSKAEIMATVWQDPPHTPIPAVGDVVLYRHHDWGDVTEATVVAVQNPDDDREDANVWYRDHTTGAALRMYPWPWLTLTLHTMYGRITCREARARGSAGWLPRGWDPPAVDPAQLAHYR